jgi:hypothetical protein
MESRMLHEIRPTWIAFGWFIAVAVTGVVLLALTAFGLVEAGAEPANSWVAAAMLLGFLAGGMMTGARVGTAPVLHGLGIGLFSIVAWLLLNLLLGEPTGATAWHAMPTAIAAALLGLQTAAAVIGARIGLRLARPPAPSRRAEARRPGSPRID